MYKIISRVKSDGSYTKCAKFDTTFISYSNKVETLDFSNIEDAKKYIFSYGEKHRVYYIIQEYIEAYDKLHIGNDYFDAGNNWFVREKYCFNNKWTKICTTKSKSYSYSRNKSNFRMSY